MWVISVRNRAGTFQHQRNIYRDSVRIGRTADNELQLPNDRVSRHHGRIDVSDNRLVYRDLGSTNGSFIQRKKVDAPVPLQIGSVIEIADYLLTVEPDPEYGGPTHITVAPDHEPITTPIEPHDRNLTWPSPVELLTTIESGVLHTQHAHQLIEEERTRKVDHEWSQLLVAVTKLREHLKADSRIAALDISNDHREVSAKVRDMRKNGGFAYLILSRGHPDAAKLDMNEAFWLREIGAEDLRFSSAREALDAFVRSIGQHIAYSGKT
ncbi:FHA domain-containing protein [Sinimarinibacterium sp. CAU 1509]|uniref:FHA domain-containing protein n=1 Tax=Sinimarinibacterium sp. CAU 1509 TaxID=2562283 RepID=UPI0010AD3D03|nr:FHA domain-containing protein [Sinimarinibacterium sp. CAU 1509]TJY62799.1 FHA domain-containing protein [Sinimarinibacterium sp. CAU 1509]